jgi:hypothetical protein
MLRAGIALALSFHTWRQLVREQALSEEQAIELAMRLVSEREPAATGTR